MRTAKILIRLGGCPGWSESSLGAHSFCWFCHVAAQIIVSLCVLDVFLVWSLFLLWKFEWRHLDDRKAIWAPSSDFVSSSIPSWQILTAHALPFRGARDLAFCLKVPLDSLLVWSSSGGSGETARMCRLAWTFAARIGDKYQIRLTRSI